MSNLVAFPLYAGVGAIDIAWAEEEDQHVMAAAEPELRFERCPSRRSIYISNRGGTLCMEVAGSNPGGRLQIMRLARATR